VQLPQAPIPAKLLSRATIADADRDFEMRGSDRGWPESLLSQQSAGEDGETVPSELIRDGQDGFWGDGSVHTGRALATPLKSKGAPVGAIHSYPFM